MTSCLTDGPAGAATAAAGSRTPAAGNLVTEARERAFSPARQIFQAKLTARSHRPTATVRVAKLG
jgi:hypothetical protein